MPLGPLRRVIQASIAVAAVVPGVVLLREVVALPPEFDQLLRICGSILAPALVLLTMLFRDAIGRLRASWVAGASALLLASGFYAAFDYWQFASDRIEPIDLVGVPEDQRRDDVPDYIVIPTTPSSELDNLMATELTYGDGVYGRNGAEILKRLDQDSRPDQLRMFWQLLLAEALLLLGFLLPAWRASSMLSASRARTE